MIEVYLFLAVFPVQILAVSVLYPIRFTRCIRAGQAKIPPERLTELYPGIDVGHAHELFLSRYRTANTVVAMLGLLLLGWFISDTPQPGWDPGAVGGLVTAYFMLQCSPLALIAWLTLRFNKLHRRGSPEGKRKAILQRRGVLDFVSPLTAVLAVLSFSLYAAVNFYVAQDPFPGFAGPFINIGIVALMYVVFGAVLYWMRYSRKIDPLVTPADRMRIISGVVKRYTWTCVLIPMLLSLSLVQKVLEVPTWGPFAASLAFLVLALVSLPGLIALPRQSEADGLGSSAAHQ